MRERSYRFPGWRIIKLSLDFCGCACRQWQGKVVEHLEIVWKIYQKRNKKQKTKIQSIKRAVEFSWLKQEFEILLARFSVSIKFVKTSQIFNPCRNDILCGHSHACRWWLIWLGPYIYCMSLFSLSTSWRYWSSIFEYIQKKSHTCALILAAARLLHRSLILSLSLSAQILFLSRQYSLISSCCLSFIFLWFLFFF